nr:MAG TPA: hypothetical protein [Caudoviricetes sp.]
MINFACGKFHSAQRWISCACFRPRRRKPSGLCLMHQIL